MEELGGMPLTLQTYLHEEILPRYAAFDAAHGIEHVTAVLRDSLEIAKDQNARLDLSYTIAAYHDVGILQGREKHHIYSGEILMKDDVLVEFFTQNERRLMQEAVEDHRASSDHEIRSLYGKIIAEADRSLVPESIMRRIVLYTRQHFSSYTPDQQYARAITHVEEKYGEQGYLKLPLASKKNQEGLKALRVLLKDEKAFRALYDKVNI